MAKGSSYMDLRVSSSCKILPYYEAIAQVIVLERKKALTYFGKEPDIIIQSFNVDQDAWLKQHSTD